MAKLIKVYDPSETKRRFAVDVQEDHCPGFLEFMTKLPFGHESALIRAVVYQWYTTHQGKGTLEKAALVALNGTGGLKDNRRSKGLDLKSLQSIQPAQEKQPKTRRMTSTLVVPSRQPSSTSHKLPAVRSTAGKSIT